MYDYVMGVKIRRQRVCQRQTQNNMNIINESFPRIENCSENKALLGLSISEMRHVLESLK